MSQPTECTCEARDGQIILSNARVAIHLDAASGVVTQLVEKSTGQRYLGAGPAEVFRLTHSRYDLHGAKSGDPWSAAYGTPILGSRQKISGWTFTETPGGGVLEVRYDRLHLERRAIDVPVRYTIELRDGDAETRWRLFLENGDPGTLFAAQFPVLAGLQPLEAVIMPNQAGQKLARPLEQLSDETPLLSLEYPGRASMQWFEYYSAQAGLYLASYDQDLSYTRLGFGRLDGTSNPAMWIERFPFAVQGAAWASPEVAVGIHPGDWHWGADRYRAWTETWMQQPEIPTSVREMISGCDEFGVKYADESLLNRYSDMPAIVTEHAGGPGKRYFMAVGWFANGHDTFYPEFRAIDDLGGETALVDALEQVHQAGARMTAYLNARLANIETQTYQQNGKKWAVLTKGPGLGVTEIEFGELHENWNRTWDKGERSEGWFAVMCPFVKARQDQLLAECVRAVRDYGFDGLFLDQPGSYWAELCYNKNHGHSTPATAWGPGYLELFRRVREATRAINPESVLFTEGLNDAYGQYLDYHMDKNPAWAPMSIHPAAETFVEMWRYTLPNTVIINYPFGYSYPPSRDPLYGENYHFVLGVREQISLRVKLAGEDPHPKARPQPEPARRRAVQEKINHLWVKGGATLFYGRFLDDVGLRTGDNEALAKLYQGNDTLAIPIWNSSAEDRSIPLEVDLPAWGLRPGPQMTITALSDDRAIPYTAAGGCLSFSLDLPAHEIDVLEIRGWERA